MNITAALKQLADDIVEGRTSTMRSDIAYRIMEIVREYEQFQESVNYISLTRNGDPDTCKKAARGMTIRKLKGLNQLVVDCLREAGPQGLTTDAVAQKINRLVSSVTPRFAPLEKAGFIVRTAEERQGITSNSMRIVWIAKEHAAERAGKLFV